MFGSFYTITAKVWHFVGESEVEQVNIKTFDFCNAEHLAENYSECVDVLNRESVLCDGLTGEVLEQYRDGECIYRAECLDDND